MRIGVTHAARLPSKAKLPFELRRVDLERAAKRATPAVPLASDRGLARPW
jgi:hypothetical protein